MSCICMHTYIYFTYIHEAKTIVLSRWCFQRIRFERICFVYLYTTAMVFLGSKIVADSQSAFFSFVNIFIFDGRVNHTNQLSSSDLNKSLQRAIFGLLIEKINSFLMKIIPRFKVERNAFFVMRKILFLILKLFFYI